MYTFKYMYCTFVSILLSILYINTNTYIYAFVSILSILHMYIHNTCRCTCTCTWACTHIDSANVIHVHVISTWYCTYIHVHVCAVLTCMRCTCKCTVHVNLVEGCDYYNIPEVCCLTQRREWVWINLSESTNTGL